MLTTPLNVLFAGEEAKAKTPENGNANHQHPTVSQLTRYKWWLQMAIFTVFVLAGQSVATLLGRLYFDKGGKGKWISTLVQVAGFPVLLPLLLISPTKKNHPSETLITPYIKKQPSLLTLVTIYLLFGVFLGANCMLYTIGLLYLPVSTYSLICASQLGFNAFFSFFLNAQKFTPLIINSLFLLTISSTLLVFNNDPSESTASKSKYAIGFVCTVGASAGYGLLLAVTQFAFTRILKIETIRVVFEMIIYPSVVAACAILVGLFASGEWKTYKNEMEVFELGKVSYVMTLVWIAIAWQVFSIGCVGLIFKVSSLFSNVISTLGLPIVPSLAVVFFHDKMDGVKVVSMLLGIWGFGSYIYQHYLDDLKLKAEGKKLGNKESPSEVSLVERGQLV
ncbi:hypothetical protein RJ640_025781 [Escallonia rubra]|uniref:Probable purine permease n=1 Tax=Escallonia rubra TaxID=112253 RepID=A0AA88RAM6_9ASTE|nr:hypothetical protein RJ640_025781 [Escallonia rubra]